MEDFTLQQVTEELHERDIDYEFYDSDSYVWAVRFTHNEYQFTIGRPTSRSGSAYASISTPAYRGVSDSERFEEVITQHFDSYGSTSDDEKVSYVNQAVRVIDDDRDGSTFVCRFHAGWWEEEGRTFRNASALLADCFEVAEWMQSTLDFVQSPDGHVHFAEPEVDLGFTAFLDLDTVDR